MEMEFSANTENSLAAGLLVDADEFKNDADEENVLEPPALTAFFSNPPLWTYGKELGVAIYSFVSAAATVLLLLITGGSGNPEGTTSEEILGKGFYVKICVMTVVLLELAVCLTLAGEICARKYLFFRLLAQRKIIIFENKPFHKMPSFYVIVFSGISLVIVALFLETWKDVLILALQMVQLVVLFFSKIINWKDEIASFAAFAGLTPNLAGEFLVSCKILKEKNVKRACLWLRMMHLAITRQPKYWLYLNHKEKVKKIRSFGGGIDQKFSLLADGNVTTMHKQSIQNVEAAIKRKYAFTVNDIYWAFFYFRSEFLHVGMDRKFAWLMRGFIQIIGVSISGLQLYILYKIFASIDFL